MSNDLPLTPDDVADIVAILDGSPYERLDIRTARFVLRVERSGEGWSQEWAWQDDMPATVAAQEDEPARTQVLADGLAAILPPLPGTFYRAPQPGAPPFVEVGDKVEPETVVAIIETMKLMNPVHAGLHGMIEAIPVENAAMVDAETPLFHVRPD